MNGTVYPRTYRYGPGWLTLLAAFALAFAAGCAWLAYDAAGRSPTAALTFGVLGGLGVPAVVLRYFFLRLTLFEDRLDYHGFFGRSVILKADIERTSGARRNWGSASIYLHLRGRRVPRRIVALGTVDKAFWRWFHDFPNTEIEAVNKRSQYLLANPAFGSNPTERAYAINRQARWLNRLFWPSCGLFLWGSDFPYPYRTCLGILMAVPLLAVIMVAFSRGRWTVNDDDRSGRMGIGVVMVVMPACTLMLRGLVDGRMADWVLTALYAGIAGIVLLLVVALIERRLSWRTALGGVFIYMVYAWGSIVFVDEAFDTAPYRSVPVQVVAVHDGTQTHELTVTAWGPRTGDNDVKTTRRLVQTVKRGDTVCIYVRPGLLRLEWYGVGHCPK